MLDLVSITLPIFLLIGLGFAALHLGVVGEDAVRGLGAFTLNFLMPALILHALLSQDFLAVFSWQYVAAYAAGSLSVLVPTYLLFRAVLRRTDALPGIAAMGAACANSGFVGFPVASLAIGAPALLALPLSMLVEVCLAIPLALSLAEISANGSGARAVREAVLRILRMPVFVAIVVGVVLSVSGVGLPAVLSRTVDMLADASIACALFTVGGTLAAMRGRAASGDIALVVAAKLILHPLAVALGFWLVGDVDPALAASGILLAASPMLTAYPIFAQRFGLAPFAATALLAATAVSFVTLTAAVALVR